MWGILCIQVDRQYTLGMELLLKVLDHVLVTMFVLGGIGSVVVIMVVIISFTKDRRELFGEDD